MSTATIDTTASSDVQTPNESEPNTAEQVVAGQPEKRETPAEYFARLTFKAERMLGSNKLPEIFRAKKVTELTETKLAVINGETDVRAGIRSVKNLRDEVQAEFDKVQAEIDAHEQARQEYNRKIDSENRQLAADALNVVCFLGTRDQIWLAQTLIVMEEIPFTYGRNGQLTLITEEDVAAAKPLGRVSFQDVNKFLKGVVERGKVAELMANGPIEQPHRSNGNGGRRGKKPYDPSRPRREMSAKQVRSASKRG